MISDMSLAVDLDKYLQEQNKHEYEQRQMQNMSSSALTRPGNETASPIYNVENEDKQEDSKELRDFEDKMDMLLDKITNERPDV